MPKNHTQLDKDVEQRFDEMVRKQFNSDGTITVIGSEEIKQFLAKELAVAYDKAFIDGYRKDASESGREMGVIWANREDELAAAREEGVREEREKAFQMLSGVLQSVGYNQVFIEIKKIDTKKDVGIRFEYNGDMLVFLEPTTPSVKENK